MSNSTIKITPAAAEQVKVSAQASNAQGMGLRIAVTRNDDGSLHYAMGFDETRADDKQMVSEDIELLVAPASIELLEGTVMDYVKLDGGDFEFIFMNPNDPGYVPPSI